MPDNKKTILLPSPTHPGGVSSDAVVAGLPERLKIFSDVQWEEFVLEWGDSLKEKYERVDRCGGAGDMGRDVIAIHKEDNDSWDNYQCKHYDHPLAPSDIWTELGKLIYYTNRGDYNAPQSYNFVAPQGVGTKLSNLLKKPDKLRDELKVNWKGYCLKKITSMQDVKLNEALTKYINRFDFSILNTVPPLRLIDQHAKTRWHIARFGGGLPTRPPVETPPPQLAPVEARYVRQLLDAYGDRLRSTIRALLEIASETELCEHFADSRIEFYSAESLRTFSRDTLPPGEYEKLQGEIHSGIKDEVRASHKDGYSRILAVIATARGLQITGHALISRLSVRDRGGICHQLANDDKLKWTK